MNDNALRLALREMQSVFRRPGPWVIVAAVVVALVVSGPFGTLRSLGLGARAGYWAAVVLLTLGAGWLASDTIARLLERRGVGRVGQWLGGGLAVSLVTVVVVGALNALVFGSSLADLGEVVALLAATVPIALLVTAAFIWGYPPPAAPQDAGLPQPPRLLDRLPLDKRGALISLSVQDHYVEVVTGRGRALLLLRLSDAMAETGDCAGLQVHRSHWVALDQVRAARREGARGILTLSDGREIPVSRTYLAAVKEAGLL